MEVDELREVLTDSIDHIIANVSKLVATNNEDEITGRLVRLAKTVEASEDDALELVLTIKAMSLNT